MTERYLQIRFSAKSRISVERIVSGRGACTMRSWTGSKECGELPNGSPRTIYIGRPIDKRAYHAPTGLVWSVLEFEDLQAGYDLFRDESWHICRLTMTHSHIMYYGMVIHRSIPRNLDSASKWCSLHSLGGKSPQKSIVLEGSMRYI